MPCRFECRKLMKTLVSCCWNSFVDCVGRILGDSEKQPIFTVPSGDGKARSSHSSSGMPLTSFPRSVHSVYCGCSPPKAPIFFFAPCLHLKKFTVEWSLAERWTGAALTCLVLRTMSRSGAQAPDRMSGSCCDTFEYRTKNCPILVFQRPS